MGTRQWEGVGRRPGNGTEEPKLSVVQRLCFGRVQIHGSKDAMLKAEGRITGRAIQWGDAEPPRAFLERAWGKTAEMPLLHPHGHRIIVS